MPTTDKTWIGTASGRKFYPFNPRQQDICIEDIAHHLSNICRFTGATDGHYSVAQHCVIGSLFCRMPLDFLMHDSSEAYANDMSRPIKHDPRMQAYRDADNRIQQVICEKFGLQWPIPECVKQVDDVMCETERRDLLPNGPDWTLGVQPLPIRIKPWTPEIAKKQFLGRFEALTTPFATLRSARLIPSLN